MFSNLIASVSDIVLPKWPAISIKGEKVSREQALEIILRTSNIHWSTNNNKFASGLNNILGLPNERDGDYWDEYDRVNKELGILQLDYLTNSQICSSYFYGPNGWCQYDGTIFQNNKNIGKWPTVEEVFHEWKIIHNAFPFLKLKCQLFDREYCEDNPIPLVEYLIENGEVFVGIPEEPMQVEDNNVERSIFDTTSEIGCSLDLFQEMVDICKGKNDKF